MDTEIDKKYLRFNGINPMTGVINSFIFNEIAPGRTNILMWNGLIGSYMYSEDAGLTWRKAGGKDEIFGSGRLILRVDVLMDTPTRPFWG